MRASRAYIAGFGTAGSLLAGAAMVFVLASAVVAFRGWPHVGDQGTSVAVVASQPRIPLDVRAVRRIVAADTALARATGAGPGTATARASAAGGSVEVASTNRVHSTGPVTKPDQQSQQLTPAANVGSAPNCAPPSCVPALQGLGSTVSHTTGELGGAVAATGSAVASTVSGLANSVARTLSGLNPGLGTTVKQAGEAVGATVNGVVGGLGGVVSGVGNALGQLLGGHH
jgi:hypothetical protein